MDVDCVFLSYDEPMADELFKHTQRTFGPLCERVRRLHGVKGISRAYRLTAELVENEWYVLVDGDCLVDEAVLGSTRRLLDSDGSPCIYVWQSRNVVNGLVYGYGGAKLVHRSIMRLVDPTDSADPLGRLGAAVTFLDEVHCSTLFNQSAEHAWRAGLREVSTLTSGLFGHDAEAARTKVDVWTSVALPVPHAEWARRGAQDALRLDLSDVDLNDPDQLRGLFERVYPSEILDAPST